MPVHHIPHVVDKGARLSVSFLISPDGQLAADVSKLNAERVSAPVTKSKMAKKSSVGHELSGNWAR